MPGRWSLFPEVANFWYFTDTSGTVHPLYIYVLSIGFSLPLSTVIHTVMVLRDASEMRLGTLTHVLVLTFWRKNKEVNNPVPPLHTESWGTSKHTYSRCNRQICGGAGNKIQISWILFSVLTSKEPFLTNQVYQTSHQTPICISAYPEICIPLWSWKRVCSLLPHPQKFDRVVKPA